MLRIALENSFKQKPWKTNSNNQNWKLDIKLPFQTAHCFFFILYTVYGKKKTSSSLDFVFLLLWKSFYLRTGCIKRINKLVLKAKLIHVYVRGHPLPCDNREPVRRDCEPWCVTKSMCSIANIKTCIFQWDCLLLFKDLKYCIIELWYFLYSTLMCLSFGGQLAVCASKHDLTTTHLHNKPIQVTFECILCTFFLCCGFSKDQDIICSNQNTIFSFAKWKLKKNSIKTSCYNILRLHSGTAGALQIKGHGLRPFFL